MTNPKPSLKKDLSALSLGYVMAGGMLFFALVGQWLDRKSGGGYKWTLGGLLLGFTVGIYEAWKIARNMDRDIKSSKKD